MDGNTFCPATAPQERCNIYGYRCIVVACNIMQGYQVWYKLKCHVQVYGGMAWQIQSIVPISTGLNVHYRLAVWMSGS